VDIELDLCTHSSISLQKAFPYLRLCCTCRYTDSRYCVSVSESWQEWRGIHYLGSQMVDCGKDYV